MKRGKFLKLLMLFLCLVLPLTGCGKKDDQGGSSQSSDTTGTTEDDKTITIAQAIQLAQEAGEAGTAEKHQVKGIIKQVSKPMYGEMTIEDETGSLFIYGVYSKDEQTRYDAFEDKPVAGDEITLLGKLKMYKGSPEMDRGYMQSFRHVPVDEQIDLSQYAQKTIAEARDIAVDSKVKISGTVAHIVYANGMIPQGFYLVGDNASIYVYDVNISAQVSVGNNVTIAGTKTYWILDSEQSYAEKYGYKGICQVVADALVSNDKTVNDIDLSWCETKTVKEIINTPVTENITTNIYKVNSLVKKVPGNGFVNYYFNDLDGTTGSYTYTSNNGNDFSWLDQYHGKICTVYLSPINCKSQNGGCIFRFMPVKVVDENFEFDKSNAGEFAIEYYAADQFEETYSADPAMEVVTSVSSELLGFENVTISYTSDNVESVYFETVDNKTIFHANKAGLANVTITATYGNYEAATRKIAIIVTNLSDIEYENVAYAINAADDTTVTIKGIVTSGVVNQKGAFYLTDETGIISVKLLNATDIESIYLGNEIVVEGVKDHNKDGATSQVLISSATVVANLYGEHEYSTAAFKSVTFEEFATDMASADNQTTSAYILKGKLVQVTSKQGSYTNITYYLYNEDGTESYQFYSGSASQYAFIDEYLDQVLTLEIAICNWNGKGNKLCLISIVTDSGKILNRTNF